MKAPREDDLALIVQSLSQTPLERLAANEAFVDGLLSIRPAERRVHLESMARAMIAARTLPVLNLLTHVIEAQHAAAKPEWTC